MLQEEIIGLTIENKNLNDDDNLNNNNQYISRNGINNIINNMDEDKDTYEVERILGHMGNGDNIQYLVKWKEYSESESTWIPLQNFNETECIKDYWNKINK